MGHTWKESRDRGDKFERQANKQRKRKGNQFKGGKQKRKLKPYKEVEDE